jgi:ribosomal protein S18 acetylase RimI-like enzyme
VSVRRATVADVAALVRLRAQMFADMAQPPGPADQPWQANSAAWFADRMAAGDCAAFVVDDPELGVVACAAGTLDRTVPGPNNPSGRRGHVFNVSTDPRRRRLGHARACIEALLDWYDREGVDVVDLAATGDGIHLYETVGFERGRYPTLRRRRPTARPGSAGRPAAS